MNVKLLTFRWAFILSVICSVWPAHWLKAQSVYEDYTFLTVAGPGSAGPGWFDDVGNAARFNTPGGIARDASGNLYVADSRNNSIRKIAPDGSVTTLAGLNGVIGGVDGHGAGATFNSPFGIAVDDPPSDWVSVSASVSQLQLSREGLRFPEEPDWTKK